jgi:hypothetical protein
MSERRPRSDGLFVNFFVSCIAQLRAIFRLPERGSNGQKLCDLNSFQVKFLNVCRLFGIIFRTEIVLGLPWLTTTRMEFGNSPNFCNNY